MNSALDWITRCSVCSCSSASPSSCCCFLGGILYSIGVATLAPTPARRNKYQPIPCCGADRRRANPLTSPFSGRSGSKTMRMLFAVPCSACAACQCLLAASVVVVLQDNAVASGKRLDAIARSMSRRRHMLRNVRDWRRGRHLSRLHRRKRWRRDIAATPASDIGTRRTSPSDFTIQPPLPSGRRCRKFFGSYFNT